MRFPTLSILSLAGIASAQIHDAQACEGKGACVSLSGCQFQLIAQESTNETAYDCGSAGLINMQEEAGAILPFRGGVSRLPTVSKAEFPATCDIAQPGPDSVLLKSVTNDITTYGFINYNCSAVAPTEEACFRGHLGQNTGRAIICKIYRNGTPCESSTKTLWTPSECPSN